VGADLELVEVIGATGANPFLLRTDLSGKASWIELYVPLLVERLDAAGAEHLTRCMLAMPHLPSPPGGP
jgi:hypothetical protein